jgi:hypothetical protein
MREIKMKQAMIAMMAAELTLASGCDFINSATELTFGEGDIPPLSQEMLYPKVEELTGLGSDDGEVIPGIPNDLSGSTMAHLVGALGASGECGQVVELGELSQNIQSAYFELSACTEDDRCSESCPENFYGLSARVQVQMLVMKADDAAELTKQLSEESSEAIAQIRLQFKELTFFQGDGEERVSTNDQIDDFQLWLGAPGVEPVQLLSQDALERISLASEIGDDDAFERYEIPRKSEVTETLISNILGGRDVVLSVDLRFKIPRAALYSMMISPAGVSQTIQPEIVIDAIKAATSAL